MLQEYAVKKKDRQRMSSIIHSGIDILEAIFARLPKDVVCHSHRVEVLCFILAKHLRTENLPKGFCSSTYRTALSKAGRYHEMGIFSAQNNIKQRPIAAEELLREYWSVDFISDYSELVFESVRCIHERYDGKGYPHGLTGAEIPLHGQLCAVANIIDKMLRDKCGARQMRKLTAYIRKNNGSIFSPEAVHYFEQAKDEIFDLYQKQLSNNKYATNGGHEHNAKVTQNIVKEG